MPVLDSKFSNFADGGDLEIDDIVVGLRNGINTRFSFQGVPNTYLPLAGGTMEGAIDMDSNEITGLPSPTNPTDAVNKAYVDAITSVVGAVGTIQRSNGTNWVPSTSTFADTYTVNNLLFASSSNAVTGLATANSGVLVTSAGGVPSIATDIPTAVTIGAAYIYRVGGTDVAVADGGTGNSSATAYAVLCGGTTSTGAFQSVSGVGTANQVLVSNGAGALPTWQSVPGLSPAALTKVDDTNVTMTLGGTPSTALLQATSITLGWSGQLGVARGGTGLSAITAHYLPIGNGTSALTLLAPSATSGVPLISQGASADPAYGTAVVAGGGTGATTLTGLLTGNGTSPFTATAITQYNVLTGGASNAPNSVAPSATSGVPLISQGASSQPAFGTAVVEGGGTGNTTFTAYSVICAGTTATGAFQNVTGVGTAGQVLSSNGAGALPSWVTIPGATSAALTRVDDTNVTLTLGGAPTTALLTATSITAGWSGQLSLARGGSNANLTASNGGIVYSTATAMAILAGTATAGQILRSGASSAPSWSTATYPATAGTSGNVLTSDGTNWSSAAPAAATSTAITDDTTTNATMYPVWVTANTGNLPLKVSSTKYAFNPSTGDLTLTAKLRGITSLASSAGLNALEFTYTASAVNYLKITNSATGTGALLQTTGSDSAVPFLLATKNAQFIFYDTTSTISGRIQLNNAASSHFTALTVAAGQSTDVTFNLPAADGSANYFMGTDGSANLSMMGGWTSGSLTVTGFSSTTTNTYRYLRIGKAVLMDIYVTGTSNATTFTATLPVTHANTNISYGFMFGQNNSTNATLLYQLDPNSATMTFYKDVTGAAFTNSGAKTAIGYFMYEST